MYNNQKHTAYPKRISTLLTIGTLVLTIGILHWAKEVFIPIALAILTSFILSPIVNLLQRKGVGPGISVTLTVVFTFLLMTAMGMLIIGEFRGLANELPAYRQNIRTKITDLHLAIKTGSLGKVHNTVQEVVNELKKEDPPEEARAVPPIPVVVKETGGTLDPAFAKSLFGPAIMTGLVIVLVIFMLLRREDLHDRVLRLAGEGRFAVTSKALKEAGQYVSRYLLRQLLVNIGFGVSVGVGLWAIGLPYALLWGFIAGVTRFIPYGGPILGVTSPVLMSLAVFDGWTALLLVLGLFTCLELLANMLIEPVLYGHGIGVSEVALVVMIAFWTWLWGAAGLVLAAPLTVCLMVISKSVPSLRFIELLLSRESALEVHRVFYHRLIARDKDEALNLVTSFGKAHTKLELFENLLIPTLISCRRDHQRHGLTDEDRTFIFQTIRQFIGEDLRSIPTERDSQANKLADKSRGETSFLLGVPANDEADELALLMLKELLAEKGLYLDILSPGLTSERVLEEVEQNRPSAVCLGFLPQGPTLSVRRLCRQLCSRFPQLPVLLGRWSTGDQEITRRRFAGLAVDFGWTLTATLNHLTQPQHADVSPKDSTTDDCFKPQEEMFFNGRWIAPEKVEIKFVEEKI